MLRALTLFYLLLSPILFGCSALRPSPVREAQAQRVYEEQCRMENEMTGRSYEGCLQAFADLAAARTLVEDTPATTPPSAPSRAATLPHSGAVEFLGDFFLLTGALMIERAAILTQARLISEVSRSAYLRYCYSMRRSGVWSFCP